MLRVLTIAILFLPMLVHSQDREEELPEYDFGPDFTYREIEERLQSITGEIPLHFNTRVMSFIDYFTHRNRPYTREVLNKKDLYFPIFEEYLAKYDLPDELKYLSIVESGLRPNAISRSNAVGLWQFIATTGRLYGLKSNWYVDERMDPFEATDAACRHLKDLYYMFGDWELALAAYNAGPGNVRKAMRRSGNKREFWTIYRYLPRETRSYVPQFVAMTYTMKFAEEHNLFPDDVNTFPEFDTVMVSQYMHIETLANQLNICEDDILVLNPQIKRGALPEGTSDFALRVPIDVKDEIVQNRSFLYDTAGKVGKAELDYLARNSVGSTFGRIKHTYKVRSGDVLGLIAQRYHVRISDIKKWNRLKSNTIYIGQRLDIWVLPQYSSKTKQVYQRTAQVVRPEIEGEKLYQVQPGDTLWSISRDYNLSVETLKKLNNLSSNLIKPGQTLVLK